MAVIGGALRRRSTPSASSSTSSRGSPADVVGDDHWHRAGRGARHAASVAVQVAAGQPGRGRDRRPGPSASARADVRGAAVGVDPQPCAPGVSTRSASAAGAAIARSDDAARTASSSRRQSVARLARATTETAGPGPARGRRREPAVEREHAQLAAREVPDGVPRVRPALPGSRVSRTRSGTLVSASGCAGARPSRAAVNTGAASAETERVTSSSIPRSSRSARRGSKIRMHDAQPRVVLARGQRALEVDQVVARERHHRPRLVDVQV